MIPFKERMSGAAASHNQIVVDQFGKQAACFARLPRHEDATHLLIKTAEVGPNDEVLDVACGPGMLACAVARETKHVIGIDLTPAMIEQARALQSQLGLSNLEWRVGDAAALPFATNRFSAVLTRYSLHHVLDPQQVVSELVRVVKPGGRVVVADLVLSPEEGCAYDKMERLRDPSHVRVLSNIELGKLMASAELLDFRWDGYLFELDLDSLLQGSFPQSGDANAIREVFERDIGLNRLGIGVHRRDGEIWFAYPIAIVSARKSW